MEQKINRLNAEEIFDQWAEAMDMDTDYGNMDEDDGKAASRAKDKVIRAIMGGHLTINEDNEAVYTPHHNKSKYKEALTFHERSGASIMATDGKKKGHDVAKMYAMLADMTETTPKTFAFMVGVDIKTIEAIFLLLMD